MPTSSRTRQRRQLPLWLLDLTRRFYAGAVARDARAAGWIQP